MMPRQAGINWLEINGLQVLVALLSSCGICTRNRRDQTSAYSLAILEAAASAALQYP
jgi:hypothetical protein